MPEKVLQEGPPSGTFHNTHENITLPLSDLQQGVPEADRDEGAFSERTCRTARPCQVVSIMQLQGRVYEEFKDTFF